MQVQWLGHASFRIEMGPGLQLYVDPWQLPPGLAPASLVVISHDHRDHCSPEDLRRIVGPQTALLGPPAVQSRLAGEGWQVRALRPGDVVEVSGVRLRAVAAYNVNKFRPTGEPFHPREKGYLGFVMEVDAVRVYFAGDTDVVPTEVEQDGPVDLALVPVGGTYVMTAREAAEQLRGRPFRYAIPMHYGAVAGSRQDAEAFRQAAACPVTVLERGQLWRRPQAATGPAGGPAAGPTG